MRRSERTKRKPDFLTVADHRAAAAAADTESDDDDDESVDFPRAKAKATTKGLKKIAANHPATKTRHAPSAKASADLQRKTVAVAVPVAVALTARLRSCRVVPDPRLILASLKADRLRTINKLVNTCLRVSGRAAAAPPPLTLFAALRCAVLCCRPLAAGTGSRTTWTWSRWGRRRSIRW
jgi:hypothetical protein